MTELMKYLDEIRFVWELIAAVNIFAVTFTRKKDRFIAKIVVTGIVITGISAIYPSVILESFDFSKMGVLTIFTQRAGQEPWLEAQLALQSGFAHVLPQDLGTRPCPLYTLPSVIFTTCL